MQFKEAIPASLQTVDVLCKKIENFLRDNGFQGDFFAVMLGIREVLINAVVHGSNLDEQNHVLLELQLKDQRLEVSVTDQGRGFNWKDVLKRKWQDKDVLREHGRGFFILREYFDEVVFSPKGNQVVIIKIL